MIKCVLQFFSISPDGKFVYCSGFSNGKAILTTENKNSFETLPLAVARDMLNKSVCVLNAPDAALSKQHKQHINKFLKGLKNG